MSVSDLEHLAEMDRLLRDVQVELAPEREPAPPLELPPPTDVPSTSPQPVNGQLQALSQLATRLLASMRELLDGYEQFLVRIPPVPAPPGQRPRRPDPGVSMAAGPFPSLETLREFELAVARLPGVRDVAVRGYEGADRAVIEVRLAEGAHRTASP